MTSSYLSTLKSQDQCFEMSLVNGKLDVRSLVRRFDGNVRWRRVLLKIGFFG